MVQGKIRDVTVESGDVFLSHKSFNRDGVGILFSNNFKPVSYSEEVVVEGQLLKVKTQY